jgi:hypothetical protein
LHPKLLVQLSLAVSALPHPQQQHQQQQEIAPQQLVLVQAALLPGHMAMAGCRLCQQALQRRCQVFQQLWSRYGKQAKSTLQQWLRSKRWCWLLRR